MTLQDLFASIDARAEMQKQVAEQDYNTAQSDCKLGIYDKWYRSHRKDDGVAYDLGWMHANEIFKNENVNFIE